MDCFYKCCLFYHRTSANSQWENECFGIYVCGVPVTRKNASDILGDGTATYDFGTNILMLSNACLEHDGSAAILVEKDLTIALDGENKIICTGPEATAGIYASEILLRKDVSFIGAGSLSIEGNGKNNAVVAGIVADDIAAYSNISIDLAEAAEDSVGIECSYLCLLDSNKVSVKIDSVGESNGIYVQGNVDLLENSKLDVVNVNTGKSSKGIECTGSFIACEGSTVNSTSGENGVGILCHGLFFDYGATVNSEIDAIGGIRRE